MSECEHNYVYGGVKYKISDYKLAGSGAQPVFYFDWFYCSKCAESIYKELPHFDNEHTYSNIKYNATPRYE